MCKNRAHVKAQTKFVDAAPFPESNISPFSDTRTFLLRLGRREAIYVFLKNTALYSVLFDQFLKHWVTNNVQRPFALALWNKWCVCICVG